MKELRLKCGAGEKRPCVAAPGSISHHLCRHEPFDHLLQMQKRENERCMTALCHVSFEKILWSSRRPSNLRVCVKWHGS